MTSDSFVLADLRSSALLAVASDPAVLADGPPLAFFATAFYPLVLADLRSATLLTSLLPLTMRTDATLPLFVRSRGRALFLDSARQLFLHRLLAILTVQAFEGHRRTCRPAGSAGGCGSARVGSPPSFALRIETIPASFHKLAETEDFNRQRRSRVGSIVPVTSARTRPG
eukprot:2831330-Rhodomonas_salina.1